MPDADRPLPFDLAALAPRADFWSVRFVEETTETLTVRNDVALPPSFDDRPRRDGDRVRRRRLRLRRDRPTCRRPALRAALERAAAWARATARHALARHPRVAAARAARRLRVAGPPPRPEPHAARLVRPAAPRSRRRRRSTPRIVDCEATHRNPHARRTGSSPAPAATSTQRFRFLLPGLRGHRARRRRHADAHAERPPRHLPAGRRRDPAALRLRRQRAATSPRRRSSCCRRPTAPPAGWTCCCCPTR